MTNRPYSSPIETNGRYVHFRRLEWDQETWTTAISIGCYWMGDEMVLDMASTDKAAIFYFIRLCYPEFVHKPYFRSRYEELRNKVNSYYAKLGYRFRELGLN